MGRRNKWFLADILPRKGVPLEQKGNQTTNKPFLSLFDHHLLPKKSSGILDCF